MRNEAQVLKQSIKSSSKMQMFLVSRVKQRGVLPSSAVRLEAPESCILSLQLTPTTSIKFIG